MKHEHLLKEIASTGYNVGYAAKKHFATFDIVEKAPGWIALVTLSIGVLALVYPSLASHHVGAAVLIVGIASLYFNSYTDSRGAYDTAGRELTNLFTSLRSLYYETKSLSPEADSSAIVKAYSDILAQSQSINISKQIFLSDWYAHYKFFWQAQIDWIDEQLAFTLWRDKVPLSAWLMLFFGIIFAGVVLACRTGLA
jgi:hypothetical protein